MKVEVVSEHEGSGDFALSPDAFKIATGKGLSKRDREHFTNQQLDLYHANMRI